MVLAGAAFGADRLFFSPAPAEAHAPAATSSAAGPVPAPASAIASAAEPNDYEVFSQRLAAIGTGDDIAHVRDVFCPTSAWPGATRTPADNARAKSLQATKDAFTSHHHLLAVMKGGRRPLALVDGNVCHRGQAIDGLRLVEIRDRSVVFRSDSLSVELPLPTRPAKMPATGEVNIRPATLGAQWDE